MHLRSHAARFPAKYKIWLKIALGNLELTLNNLDRALFWLDQVSPDFNTEAHKIEIKKHLAEMERSARKLLTAKRSSRNKSTRSISSAKKRKVANGS